MYKNNDDAHREPRDYLRLIVTELDCEIENTVVCIIFN